MVQSSCCNFTELSHCFCEVLEHGAFFLKFLGFVLLLFGSFILSVSLVCGVSSEWELWWVTFKSSWEQDFSALVGGFSIYLLLEWTKRISVSAVLSLTCRDFL